MNVIEDDCLKVSGYYAGEYDNFLASRWWISFADQLVYSLLRELFGKEIDHNISNLYKGFWLLSKR